MNNSGDAAEQVIRLSLEGTEVALKLTGSAAKNIAAAIYAVLKNRDKNKVRGRQRLTAMLKSGKELKVFTVSEAHLKQFALEAKRYGVVYCALRGKNQFADGMVDVMVRAEDASKINRIVERFKLATVDAASIKSEIQQSREERAGSDKAASPAAPGGAERGAELPLLRAPRQPVHRRGGPAAGRYAGSAHRTGGGCPGKPFCGTDGKISGLRAYLREAQQNRRGCC